MEEIKIAIADDQTLFRQTVASFIKSVDSFRLVAEAENAESLLKQLPHLQHTPDITLIDMKMPGISGIDLNAILQQQFPEIKVIVLSMYDDKRLISTLIHAGARSYLQKTCDKEELITAINNVHRSGFYINNNILNAIQSPAATSHKPIKSLSELPFSITKREKEVLQLICQELSNAEIADKLSLSIRTVEGHRNNLLLKIGCKNTAGLVLFAVKYNIYDLALRY
jgi:DNA-binding NarL/FixJ family response regulator